MLGMLPCPACKRHLRATEVLCPFCGVNLPSTGASGVTAIAFAALALLGTTACSPGRSADGDGGTTTSHDSTTDDTTDDTTTVDDSSESGMTETETDTDDGPDDTNSEGGSFYAGPAPDWGGIECDPWFQDCPEGEKCVPYASTGGTWDANKCVPIQGDGAPGDACNYGGAITADDSCDGTSICWNTEVIDGSLVGTCTPFCMGVPDDPECAEGSSCVIGNDGSINLCLQSCDPLEQNCPDGLACHWYAEQFVCVQSEDEPPNQPCDFVGDCPAGSVCVNADVVPDCAGSSCCTAFCSISEPSCMEPTSECIPYFEDPPVGYEDVGICGAP